MNKVYGYLEDIILWPDNSWCYRYEHGKYGKSDDFIVVPYGSLFYPDGITIYEVDYDRVVKARIAMLGNVANNNR